MAKDVNIVVRHIKQAIALHKTGLERRIKHNRHGFTEAEIYTAMGTAGAAHIAKAEAAVTAIAIKEAAPIAQTGKDAATASSTPTT